MLAGLKLISTIYLDKTIYSWHNILTIINRVLISSYTINDTVIVMRKYSRTDTKLIVDFVFDGNVDLTMADVNIGIIANFV